MHRALAILVALTACTPVTGAHYKEQLTRAVCEQLTACAPSGDASTSELVDECVAFNVGLGKTGDDAALFWGCGEGACTFDAGAADCTLGQVRSTTCGEDLDLSPCGEVFTDCDEPALDACLAERGGGSGG